MIGADTVKRILALAAIAPFDRLTERELLLIAGVVQPRRFAPGALLVEAGQTADMLYACTGGRALCDGAPMPPLFDAASLLFGLETTADVRAGPDGLDALCLAKPHLFTIARECPDFILGLVEMSEGRR